MGTESGHEDTHVAEWLEDELRTDPHSFGFFQAVRLLHRLRPERREVGSFVRPKDEVVHFAKNPSVGYPPGEIQELDLDAEGPARLEQNFFGLVGRQMTLPSYYTRLVWDERYALEQPLTDFLNMLQHRMTSLFYRAWERGRFYVPFERGHPDRVSAHLFDLIGLGGPKELRDRMKVRDDALVFYSGLLGMVQRSATALQQLLTDFFEVPVDVKEFVGAWYPLSDSTQCRVDDANVDVGSGLGEGTIVGDEVWDPQAKVLIRVGPLTRAHYEDFLPGGEAHTSLRSIAHFFSDDQFDFDVQLVLARDEVPGIELGGEGDQASLGWVSWIRSTPQPFAHHRDDTTLSL